MEEAGKLSLLADVLRANGYVVFAAQSGAAALLAIESNGLPDLVLMKADMSLMTGVRTLSALLDRDYSGPVIMIVRAGARPPTDELPPVPDFDLPDAYSVAAQLAWPHGHAEFTVDDSAAWRQASLQYCSPSCA
jgi:CheY-like chemotaxis protein